MSRLHEVLGAPEGGRVTVRDLDGAVHVLSMLAFDGPEPAPGQWLVAHSGFALCPAGADDVAATLAEWPAPPAKEEVDR